MKPFHHFRLLITGLVFCLGALSTNAFALMGGAVQNGGVALGNASGASGVTVSTLAGSAGLIGSTDGTGTVARFNSPMELTTDGTNLYVESYGDNTIRKVVMATGVVTTLAGSAGVFGSTDGTGTAARFSYPAGITTDGANLYVSDLNNFTIRKVVIATGVVTTLAGSAGVSGSTDGTGTAARFNGPHGLTTDGTNLYVADMFNQTIRKVVIATGAVTTLAGSAGLIGSTDGTAARFFNPVGITTDSTNLYVTDQSNHTIRQIVIATGAVTTLAGSAGVAGSVDGTGTAARFNNPMGITTDSTNLYVTDDGSNTIRKVVIATGVVTTIAGSAGVTGSTDGTGDAARFYYPWGITTDGINLYVAGLISQTIRKISALVATAPDAPTIVTATPGNGNAAVSFTAPSNTGGSAITGYTATCGSSTATGTSSPITVTGLTNGAATTCSVTATNATGTSAASGTASVTPIASQSISFGAEVIIQPGPEGTDTCYGTAYATSGCPDAADLYIGGWGDTYYDFFKFDLTGSPSSSTTVKVELWLYGSAPNDPAMQMNRITGSWTETGVTLASNPSSTFYKNMPAFPSANAWIVTDITDLYKGWKDGIYPNYGVKLVPTNISQTNGSIASSDNANASSRPKLIITAKTNQSVSFGTAPTIVVGGTGTISASATSGLAVSFSSLTPGICTVSGSTIAGVTAGTCTIAADQAGNASYAAAPQATQNITIGAAAKTSQTISFTSVPAVVAGGTGTISATATSGLAVSFSSLTTGICSVNGSAVTGIASGSCIIAADQAGNTSFSAATQVAQAITVVSATFTDNGNGTVTDITTGLTWMRCAMRQTWDGSTCSGYSGYASGYTWDEANALTGTVNFAGYSDWYLPSITELKSIVDLSYSPTINPTFFPNSPTADCWSATAYPSLPGNSMLVFFNAGGNSYYGSNSYLGQVRLVRGGLSLGPFALSTILSGTGSGTVTSSTGGINCGTTCSATYTSGTSVTLTATPSSASTFTGWSGACTGTGSCFVSMSAAKSVSATFTLGQASQTISFATAPTVAISGTGTVFATATSGLPVTYTSLTQGICYVSGSTVTGITAGTCTIAANQAGNTSFSAATQVTQNIIIGQASQTISFGTAPTVSISGTGTVFATATSGLPVTYTSLTQSICYVTGSIVSGIASGTCIIAASQTGNANFYAAVQVTQSITIGIKSYQTVSFYFPPKLIAGGNGPASAFATSGLAVSFSSLTPSICSVGGSTVYGIAAGTCTIAANQTGNTNYYAATQATQSITVGNAPAVSPMAAAGEGHSIALKSDGTVMAWGWNSSGQLGDGTWTHRLNPVAVPGLAGVIAVSAGAYHSVALKADGTVMTWGDNTYGQLGDGTTTPRFSPLAVLTNVVAVVAGTNHTVAIKADGTVVAWGLNDLGQLGDGTIINRSSPVAVSGLAGVIAIAAGDQHTVALKADRTLMAWGSNSLGQLGDGTSANRLSPVPVLSGVVAVSAGAFHTVALKSDSTAMAWGSNSLGQLGDGTITNRSNPVAVAGLNAILTVTARSNYTVAIKADSTMMAWGSNYSGQLGDGTTTQHNSPLAVRTLSGVAAVAAGANHIMAIKADGSIAAWGDNSTTQLGDGTFAQRLTPVLVVNSSADGFLNLKPGTTLNIPPELDVPFFVSSTGGITASSATVSTTIKFKAADVNRSNSVFVTAMVPSGSPLALSASNVPRMKALAASAANTFVQIQLTPTGWQQVINGQLIPYVTGLLGAFSGTQSILNNTNTTNFPGAQFCVGYGTSAAEMIATGKLRVVATLQGNTPPVSCTEVGASKTNQTIGAISFSPATLAVGGTATVSATATSGLAATFSSTTPSVCYVNGATVIYIAAGTCTIAADQAGNVTYNAATQVTNNITAGNISRSDCIFNWAEKNYAQYFAPAGVASATYTAYYYRYYSGTGNYLATSSADNNLYAIGPATGNSLLNVGLVTDFLGVSGCP